MTITAAGLAGGGNANNIALNGTATRSMGSVTAGQLIVIGGAKFSPSSSVFVAGNCTKSAGTATIDTVQLDRVDGGDLGSLNNFGYTALWSTIVTGSGTLTMAVNGGVASSYVLIGAEAFNGTWDSSRVDGAGNGATTQTDDTSSATTGNATSTGAGLFVGAVQVNSNEAFVFAPDAAFTTIYENESSTDDSGSFIYRIVSSSTTDSADWSFTQATPDHGGTACSLVVYREATAAGRLRLMLSYYG